MRSAALIMLMIPPPQPTQLAIWSARNTPQSCPQLREKMVMPKALTQLDTEARIARVSTRWAKTAIHWEKSKGSLGQLQGAYRFDLSRTMTIFGLSPTRSTSTVPDASTKSERRGKP